MLRLVGVLVTIVAFVAAESPTYARFPALTAEAQGADQAAMFITLPMTKGFANATHVLVDTQRVVREALNSVGAVRLVERVEDSDAVLTVIGRGTGHAELNAALQTVDPTVVASPVMISSNKQYVEAMLTVGSCGDAATSVSSPSTSASCYRKVFVGLCVASRTVRQNQNAALNSWNACANALARDVQAWFTQNASRLLLLPP